MKNKIFKFILIIFFSLIFFKIGSFNAEAATIGIYPSIGNLKTGQSFTVDLKVDGAGKSFNVAQTSISLSNFTVKNLILGDCNFAFIKTPQLDSPSFTGGILGSSSSGCTVYTLTLMPIGTGTASLNLTKSSIIESKTTREIYSSAINGNYTVSGSGPAFISSPTSSLPSAPTKLPNNVLNQNQNNNYDIQIQVFSLTNNPISGAEVSFNSGQKKNTDDQGIALFTNLEQGMYQIDVISQNRKISSTVLNVGGTNHKIVLGIKEQKEKINIWIWIVVIVIILLVPIGIIGYKKYKASQE